MTATVIIKYKSFLNCVLPAFLAKYFPQAAQSTQEELKNGLLWVGLKCIIGKKKKREREKTGKVSLVPKLGLISTLTHQYILDGTPLQSLLEHSQILLKKRLFKVNLWKLHRNSHAIFESINVFC